MPSLHRGAAGQDWEMDELPARVRRGPGRSYDPFNEFERLARDDDKPFESPEPKAERQLLALLGSKAALVVMSGLLVVVAFILIVLMTARLA
jgi:hypothetical protein